MLEIGIMIEGQNGLTWSRWQRIARAVEDLGFCGLFRSDHYTNANPPDKDSLELWISLAWLASHTTRIQFGPLVSPVSFRHPTLTARMASAVDDLSAGRLVLGLGAGWQAREHTHYGWDLLDIRQRFVRFEEGLQVITRLLESESPQDFDGQYYRLKDATLLPRPARPGGPPVLIGGNGSRLTLPLVARYAQEWNAVFLPPEKFKVLNQQLDDLLRQSGRQPGDVRRSIMLGCIHARSPVEIDTIVNLRSDGKFDARQLQERGLVVGTAEQILEQLSAYQKVGAYRVMLQWLDLDDVQGLETLAHAIYAG